MPSLTEHLLAADNHSGEGESFLFEGVLSDRFPCRSVYDYFCSEFQTMNTVDCKVEYFYLASSHFSSPTEHAIPFHDYCSRYCSTEQRGTETRSALADSSTHCARFAT